MCYSRAVIKRWGTGGFPLATMNVAPSYLLQNIYVLGLQYEKRHMTLETLRINFASPYHGQIITKIALELVAPSYETNSRVM